MTESLPILEQKRALRARMRAWRDGLDNSVKVHAAQAIAEQGVALVTQLSGSTSNIVSGFASLPEELNVWPLLRRLHGAGFGLALPMVAGKGLPLVFRTWAPGDAMAKGVWDIPEPKADKPEVEPDILLVPLLAFDMTGCRLGYGGGFYDRTLERLRSRKRVVAAGLAFDEQRIDVVPHLDYDQRLDWVLTPSGPIKFSGQ